MTELAKCTWIEAERLLGPETVALLPIGSTEPHGPHLPLDTDVTIALAQTRCAAERFEEAGVRALVLPPLPYGLTNYTDGFAGRVTLKPGTLWALVEDVVESLEQQGVRRVLLVNGHLEPEHVAVLRNLATDRPRIGSERAQIVLADVTRRAAAATLGEEFLSGDCHAGRYESSLVLFADPGSVREDQRAELPAVRIDLLEKMKAGARTFLEVGADAAYCGDPAAATSAEG
ncbi:MAG TPA: creatininase family protein, partial [Planctomycetota bacterium]|nr:creatininase family protein [Planctomycetota bacterium]